MRGMTVVGIAASLTFIAGTASAQTCIDKTMLGTFGGNRSVASGVSADGRFVVGSATNDLGQSRAFLWTAEGGMENLGVITGPTSTATAVSADGSVVVGSSTLSAQGAPAPVRWTRETGMVPLSFYGGTAIAVSDDGSVVAGNYETTSHHRRIFRWTQESGFVTLDIQTTTNTLHMLGMSADGSVIVGNRSTEGASLMPFIWTEQTGAVDLTMPGGDWSEAMGVSPDGQTIVGALSHQQSFATQAVRWSASGAGPIEETPRSGDARATSVDGQFIVGDWSLSSNVKHAYRWDATTGFLDLGTIDGNLTDSSHAQDISGDGSVVVGHALHNEFYDRGVIWRIRDLGIDFNGDGFVDFFDYDAFVECFEGGACPDGRTADHNGDGFLDFFDYDSFVVSFQSGC